MTQKVIRIIIIMGREERHVPGRRQLLRVSSLFLPGPQAYMKRAFCLYACMYTTCLVTTEVKDGVRCPWDWSYQWLLEIEIQSSDPVLKTAKSSPGTPTPDTHSFCEAGNHLIALDSLELTM